MKTEYDADAAFLYPITGRTGTPFYRVTNPQPNSIINYSGSTGVDENGNTIEFTDFAEQPRFIGLKMKDGTVYTGILDGGTYGYENGDTSTYIAKVGISRVINPKEVQNLLFLKDDNAVTGEHEITEKECYVVDIN